MQVWILTFNRPKVLSRQVKLWGRVGFDVHVYSNYPEMRYEDNETYDLIKSVHINSNSYKESNSYCARSWNNIFIKAFMNTEIDGVFVQDDTECDDKTPQLIRDHRQDKDFIWGPAGDTFFYLKREVLKRVGWFDERYLACYCGDADFMLRTFISYYTGGEIDRISIEETHDWGWFTNPIGITKHIRWDLQSKCLDADYQNQHWELEKQPGNPALVQSQSHFKAKWGFPGNGINGIGPIAAQWNERLKDQQSSTPPYIQEIDWYPWFTAKYLK
jgi:hypothetical protein